MEMSLDLKGLINTVRELLLRLDEWIREYMSCIKKNE